MTKRENGFGTIYKRKLAHGIRYTARAPAVYTVDKKTGAVSCSRLTIGTYERKSDAQAALEEYRKHPTAKYNYTLRQIYDEWSPNAFTLISRQTVSCWKAAWKHIDECPDISLADEPLRNITTGHLRTLVYHYVSAGKSKSTVTKLKALLTQLYDYALENNIIDRNFAKLVKLPKFDKPQIRAFSDIEFAKLDQNWQSVPGGDAVLVLCYTGFRVSEFCSLTVFSYDAKAQTLTGGMKTEAGENRIVPVHSKIKPILDRWAAASSGPLFADENGKPYNKDSFRLKVWRPALTALGLPDDLNPHAARHTCATRLSAAGVPTEDIQRIIGHADYSVTANTYVQQDIATLTRSMNKMA